eukprot:4212669-Prymnesium_polylepis.1
MSARWMCSCIARRSLSTGSVSGGSWSSALRRTTDRLKGRPAGRRCMNARMPVAVGRRRTGEALGGA